jgi:hypothetical protein
VLALRDVYEEIWLQVLGEAKEAGFIRGDVFITRRFSPVHCPDHHLVPRWRQPELLISWPMKR